MQNMHNMSNIPGMPQHMSDQAMMNMSFGPRSNGTRLSPTAAEFQASYGGPGWSNNNQVSFSITSFHPTFEMRIR